MAREVKPEHVRYTSEFGVAGFCALNRPFEEFYKVALRFEGAAAQKMASDLDKHRAISKKERGKVCQPPYTWEEDDDGEKTGALVVNFKQRAGGVIKSGPKAGQEWSAKPKLLDSAKNEVTANVDSGSKLRVVYTVRPTEFGGKHFLQLCLRKAQIKELVEWAPDEDDDLDEVEDGYVANVTVPTEEEPELTFDSVSDDDDGDY